jgi:hypothetical protein
LSNVRAAAAANHLGVQDAHFTRERVVGESERRVLLVDD